MSESSPRPRILLVEDSHQNAKLAREILSMRGYESAWAATAEDALKLAQRESFDLVLMDVQLPGMDGLTATRKLKETSATRDIPVIGLSALAHDDDRQRGLDAGCIDYVSKPYRIDQLVTAIEAALTTIVK